MNKKGEAFQMLVGLASAIAAIAIILVITFMILASGKSQISAMEGNNSAPYNATLDTTVAVADGIPVFLPIIILAGVGVAILSVVSLLRNR